MRPRHRFPALDRALVIGAIVLVGATLFTAARVHRLGDPTAFIVAGSKFVDPAKAPAELQVATVDGYDGQFFYRLARRPLDHSKEVDGVRFDTMPYRQQRIGYPLAAWILSIGGQQPLVPWVLIAVNVIGVGLLGWLGGLLAQALGRHAAWGLALAAYPGFALALSRDLAEVATACWLCGGVLMWLNGRPFASSALLCCAVLTRETSLVIPLGFAAAWMLPTGSRQERLLSTGSRQERSLASAAPFAGPLLTFAAWQAIGWVWFDELPVLAGIDPLAMPFTGITHAISANFGMHGIALPQSLEAGLLGALTLLVLASLARSTAPLELRLAWVGALALLVVASAAVWAQDWAYMRAATEFEVTAYALLLAGPSLLLVTAGVGQVAVALPVLESLARSR